MKCKSCERNGDTRIGFCWKCAEAESIISNGLDMYDEGPNGGTKPAHSPMDKVKFLIKKGWKQND